MGRGLLEAVLDCCKLCECAKACYSKNAPPHVGGGVGQLGQKSWGCAVADRALTAHSVCHTDAACNTEQYRAIPRSCFNTELDRAHTVQYTTTQLL
jgi:hypothetical protein